MHIKEILLKDNQRIQLGKLSVLVGPNNVGKSQTLRDIYNYFFTGINSKRTLVEALSLDLPRTLEELLKGLLVLDHETERRVKVVRGIKPNLLSGEEVGIDFQHYKSNYEDSQNTSIIFGTLSKFKISYLDAGSRLQVARRSASFNPSRDIPQNLVQLLLSDEKSAHEKLRKIFKETFGMDIYLDYSGFTELLFRLAEKFENIPEDPKKANLVFREKPTLDEQGDGFRSFVGVVLSLLLSDGRIILLDEPEAFLHPAQARQLGAWISDFSSESKCQIIIATHNANFLQGILSSGQPVEIFRLNRKGDQTKLKKISSSTITDLVKSPVLSSQRVIESIFHRGVMVCEGDADRAFYQTVATMWLRKQDVLFLHAHNKQTIPRIIKLLADAEIPSIAIVDIDILDSEEDLQKILDAFGDNATKNEMLQLRKEISEVVDKESDEERLGKLKRKIDEFSDQLEGNQHNLAGARGALNRLRKEANDWSVLKEKGIGGFPQEVREKVTRLIDTAKDSNLFIVPVGEVEGWFDLGVTRKNKWITLALEELYNGRTSEALKTFLQEGLNKIYSKTN